MEINHYNTYSAISAANDKDKALIEDILNKVNGLDNCANFDIARKYLEETFDMPQEAKQFAISGEYPVKITESSTLHIIKIVVKNNNFTYCFRREK